MAAFGAGSAPSFQGGASSGGNQQNQWGDNTGSDMVMNNGGMSTVQTVVAGVVGLAVVAGVVVWITRNQ
ncbi:MAG: hypothetical protein KAU94_02250 [Verrucomicrobia bacterium]|nr:hypothetical protein [Verrucomicrobiota bacterium]